MAMGVAVMDDPAPKQTRSAPEAPPWVAQLAVFLRQSAQARAVDWDDAQTEVAVATVGRVDETELRRLLEETLSAPASEASAEWEEEAASGLRLKRSENGSRLEKLHGCAEVETLWRWRKVPWPTPAEAAGLGKDAEDEDWRELAVLAGLCGVFGLAGLFVQWSGAGPEYLAPVLYVLAMIAGGWDAAKEAIPGVFKGRLDIHFLMLAVAVGASFIGAFGEGALLLFLFSTAGALEHFALHRTRREIHALFRVAPKTAIRIDAESGSETAVPVERIAAGDLLRARPGDTIAVDGVVVAGESAADESSLTGEAHPVAKRSGEEVFSGTLNLWGAVDYRCLRPASQSALQKIIHLIQQARHQRAPSQRFTDRFGPRYTIGVLLATTGMFFVWWLGFGVPAFLNVTEDGRTTFSAFYRAMTLLVVASPCALVLSIPSAILAAIAWGARHGILFRGGAAIEELAGIGVVALDKTGTLTTGDLRVVAVESFPPGREQEVAELAFTMERKASHPIARAIVRYGESRGLQTREVDGFRSLAGRGLRAEVDRKPCLLGRRELLMEGPLEPWARDLPEPPQGLSEVWFVYGGLLGRILLEDTLRTESPAVLRRLKEAGLRTVMLTGDRAEAAREVARRLGLDEVRAGLSPEGKVEAVRELAADGRRVAMVGDGINDAPCLAAADVAVAMGARGSDAALEQSDVVLMNDRIENFHEAFRLSRRARRIIRQNIALSLGTIVVMVGAAVFGVVPITLGVLAHEGSTVLVCLNSMRLLGGKTEAG
ncbi:MAG: heavy metal translocating P-type ATPase [Puniceicoccaceae bacterium]|nr:MAG: heavy metal translocating P-type ATPase [Puniceicoccaceae bacterium]